MPSKQAGNMSALETDNGVVNLSSEYYSVIPIDFEVSTVGYRSTFFCPIYGPSAKHTGHKSWKNKQGYYSPRQPERNSFIN